ncbi:hypothetical protein SMAC4_13135 [Sordaria macrospora]|uniref:uncharacterized protein n=1 Tax=Sordaria macrospora TaxID=5147 RepID=UPI002B2F62F4|nr:hypothetical protein SMAC4_13135 [Sordaria macrospora]
MIWMKWSSTHNSHTKKLYLQSRNNNTTLFCSLQPQALICTSCTTPVMSSCNTRTWEKAEIMVIKFPHCQK